MKQKEKILHIDDEVSNKETILALFDKSDYEIIPASTGREGLKLAETLKPDLIILSLSLPDIDGLEICRVLKSRPELRSIPVIHTFPDDKKKVLSLESDADGYLTTPFVSDLMIATVHSHLRRRDREEVAHEAQRAQEEILAIVSHDLRNPLSAVMLQAKIIKKGIEKGDDPKKFNDHLDRIERSCQRMNKLIEDLLVVTNLEQGRFTLKKSFFSITELIDEIMMTFEELAAQKQIRLHRRINSKEEFFLSGDRDRILQAFGNLISNAMRFTSPQGNISVGVEANEASCVFTVSDDGPGIPENNLPHIFDRYWQGHKDRSTGVGLGLSIVKGIVEAHDGSVWADSTFGEGASFSFLLPR